MNSYVYIFGNLGNGYTQYPDDYAKDIFLDFYNKSTAPSQITIHRDNNLIYYGYIRKLDISSQYIGFCVLLNGVMFSQIGRLFSIFEDIVADLVTRGEIIHFNVHGDITASIDNLNQNQQAIERVVTILQNQFSDLIRDAKKIPPTNYGICNTESQTFSESDKNEDIINASYKYGYTFILKDHDYNTLTLTSFKSILSKLNEEKDDLNHKLNELKSKYNKLLEQKKQYRKVVFLCILLALFGVGMFLLNDSLNNTQSHLKDAQNDISQKDETINALNEEISNLESSLYTEKSKRENAESELSTFKNSISSYMPIKITDVEIANVYYDGSIETDYGETIYSSYSMYFKPKISYEGIKTGENITINIKLYTPSGIISKSPSSPSDCSWKESFYVYDGSNTQSFQGWGGQTKGHWSSGQYRYEFWYDNVCLKSKSFTIY